MNSHVSSSWRSPVSVWGFHRLWPSLTPVSVSFQRTPAFWEEEEVSDHPFFPFLITSSPCFLFSFFLHVIKAIKLALIRSHILAHLSVAFSWLMADISVHFPPSVCAKCGWMSDRHMSAARHTVRCATLRRGHYFSGLPKNIIIKAMEEIWGSRAWCGHNGLGTPGEHYLPTPLFFFSEIWLLLWHDWDNHSLSQGDEVWVKCTQLEVELFILSPDGDFWWSVGNDNEIRSARQPSLFIHLCWLSLWMCRPCVTAFSCTERSEVCSF